MLMVRVISATLGLFLCGLAPLTAGQTNYNIRVYTSFPNVGNNVAASLTVRYYDAGFNLVGTFAPADATGVTDFGSTGWCEWTDPFVPDSAVFATVSGQGWATVPGYPVEPYSYRQGSYPVGDSDYYVVVIHN
jgi:hypothetical protein